MKQKFSISLQVETNSEKPVTEAAVRRFLTQALTGAKSEPFVENVRMGDVIDMTESIAYREQLEADRKKAVGE